MSAGRAGRWEWARSLGCDLRSLAVFRVALGLLLLAGLAARLPEFRAHYTDAGAWPIAAAREDAPWMWSLYFLNGSAIWTATLFAISALAALALTLGWWTRTATVLSWLLLLSLQYRNELVLNGGDVWLRLMLLWSTFLPLGACWSLDARRRGARYGEYLSAGTALLLGQLVIVYFFNALFKQGAVWQGAGTAAEEALRMQTYATALGGALLAYPEALKFGTRLIWYLELLGPWLIFIPWRIGWWRMAAVILFIGFHLGLFCTLRIGLFPLIGIAAWLPVIPAEFWDRWRRQSALLAPARYWWSEIPAGVMLVAVLEWNILGYKKIEQPRAFDRTVRTVGVDQKWKLFAPRPLRSEGWHIAVIETADAVEYDAFTGAEVDWERPASLAERAGSVNWRKFMASVRGEHPKSAKWVCAWLVREWESAHPGAKVTRIRLHYLWEWTADRSGDPKNYLIYENPPGPMTDEARRIGWKLPEPGEGGDN